MWGFLLAYESPLEMSRRSEDDGPRRGSADFQQKIMRDRLSGAGKFAFDEKRIIVAHIDLNAKHTLFTHSNGMGSLYKII